MILHRYFALRFLVSFVTVFAVFFLIVGFIGIVEQIRILEAAGLAATELATMTLLDTPRQIYQFLPLIMIIAAINMFLRLAKSSELVVTRAAGRSAIKSLVSPTLVAALIGFVSIALFNPIVAATSKEYERRASVYLGEGTILSVEEDSLWLRQGSGGEQTVIRAEGSNLDGTELRDATFISFLDGQGPSLRIEARSARLEAGQWQIKDAKVWPLTGTVNPEADATHHETYTLASTLTPDQIRDSFGSPSSVTIWELPQFIERLHDAGLAARRHEVWFQSELAQPLFLMVMVLIGAGFTMRHQRGGGVGLWVMGGIGVSFTIYFIYNFSKILGENGQIPIALSVWSVPVAGLFLALGLLLHLEDG